MRRPTPTAQGLQDWQSRLAGVEVPIIEDQPQAGFYKSRAWDRGPWLPGRIWIVSEVDWVTGELVAEERFAAEIGGKTWDALEAWLRLAKHPVTVAEYHWLQARMALHQNYPRPDQQSL